MTLICVCLVLLSCNKEEEDEPIEKAISAFLINQIDSTPVSGASIQVLEDGPISSSLPNGEFYYLPEDLIVDDWSLNGQTIGVSVMAEGYKPIEVNISLSSVDTINLIPDSVANYTYHQPVLVDDGLETGTLSDGSFNATKIQTLMEKAESGKYKELHSILIYRHGKLVLEEYFYGNHDTIDFENNITRVRTPAHDYWTRNSKHYVASVNKSITASITAIALNTYGHSRSDQIFTFLPSYSSYFADQNKAALTFSHVLGMNMGFQWDEWGSNDLALLWKSDDFTEFVMNRTNMGPYSEWRYNSAGPNMLLNCLDNMVEGDIRTWAHANFFGKLGIEDYDWGYQPDGLPEGAARMFMRSRDLLKIGVTYLNDGVWLGEQVLPEGWSAECQQVRTITTAGNYSFLFWIRELRGATYLSADGDGGNYINIFPSLDMVVVITQGNYLEWPLYVTQADEMMSRYIISGAE